jgi:hypothetical protein
MTTSDEEPIRETSATMRDVALQECNARGRAWRLRSGDMVIGRSDPAQIVLDDSGVSRRHARLEKRSDGWWIQDLGSTNGTFVNGRKITEQRLRLGDRIQLGPFEFQLVVGQATSGTASLDGPGQGVPGRRRGWRPPGFNPPREVSGADLPGPDRPATGGQKFARPEGGPPNSVLANSLSGLARNVALATTQTSDSTSKTVVTFRLEQYDPHAGRTGIVNVRLRGDQAIGFAADGDWVEVTGRSKRGFVDAKEAFNQTSGAQFRARPGFARGVGIAGLVIVIGIAALAIVIMLIVAKEALGG